MLLEAANAQTGIETSPHQHMHKQWGGVRLEAANAQTGIETCETGTDTALTDIPTIRSSECSNGH